MAVDEICQEVISVQAAVGEAGEHAGFELITAFDGPLGEGDALDGQEFGVIDRAVGVDEIGPEVSEGLGVFAADEAVRVGGEAMLKSVLRGAGTPRGGTR
jgi:hypothetical protein